MRRFALTRRYVVPPLKALRALALREQTVLRDEVLQMKGLMPLLMKRRNGGAWTAQERTELLVQLRRLSVVSPCLIVLVLPGGFLVLPALAWWLDRRRRRQQESASGQRR